MTRWLAAPVVAALVLAGCGQSGTEEISIEDTAVEGEAVERAAVPTEADRLLSDCIFVDEVSTSATSWLGSENDRESAVHLYLLQMVASLKWPQLDDSDAREIVKALAEPDGIKHRGGGSMEIAPEARRRLTMEAFSLSSWKRINCPD